MRSCRLLRCAHVLRLLTETRLHKARANLKMNHLADILIFLQNINYASKDFVFIQESILELDQCYQCRVACE